MFKFILSQWCIIILFDSIRLIYFLLLAHPTITYKPNYLDIDILKNVSIGKKETSVASTVQNKKRNIVKKENPSKFCNRVQF